MEIKTSGLVVVGDIHGDFSELVWMITEKYKITDTTFIVAGDCGIGFDKSLGVIYNRKLKNRLERNKNTLLCLRGNHDNPKYFREDGLVDYPYLKSLPDYTHLRWGSRKILVIGGGISVDKKWRLEEMKKTKKEIWWPDEGITHSPELLDTKEDIIISHMAPLCIGPVLMREKEDHEIWAAEKSDREYLSTVLKETRPTRWIFGHYHESISGDYEDCLWRGLKIQEIYEIR